ncbi:MAG: glycine-rich protein [Bacteroidia bacterium]
MKKHLFFIALFVCFVYTINYSQCISISCPGNITFSNTASSCSAIVNYGAPVVTNNCSTSSYTFNYTGSTQTFVVPAGVTAITIETWGAQGGANWVNNTNYGGYAKGTFSATPGQTLAIYVGSQATGTPGGYNGGGNGEGAGQGGGGASDVRTGAFTLNDRIIVAGGGGGAGYWSSLHVVGGVGGGLVGGDGYRDTPANPGGQGGTQTSSGYGTCVSFSNTAMAGGFGYGGSPSGCGCEGYGGGGGWYGGAGSGNCRGGGGGSGYLLPSATNTVFTSGLTVGNGKVVITYAGAGSTYTTSMVSGMSSGSSFPLGTTVQTYTVVESNNNSASCSFSVTVVDAIIPTITCPNNIASCAALVSSIAPVFVGDNCSASVTYTLSGASTGTGVTNASGTFNTGITSVVYKAADAAGNSATCNFSVTVNVLPTVVASNSNTLICAGQPATLTATGANTYTWNTSATGSSVVVTPTITTTYTVNGTDANGCTNSSAITQSVSACTGLASLTSNENGYSVYPNPNNGEFTIQTPGKTKLVIHNVLGSIVLTKEVEKGSYKINIGDQASGVYFIDATSETGKQTFRIIKNN